MSGFIQLPGIHLHYLKGNGGNVWGIKKTNSIKVQNSIVVDLGCFGLHFYKHVTKDYY